MKNLPHTDAEVRDMLASIGVGKIEDLFSSIPESMRSKSGLSLGNGMSEPVLKNHITALAQKNKALSCSNSFIGAGAYRHYVPAAVTEIASRSEFVTPYTPYQPEISQGTLQTLFEYQSMICRLFEMDVSNASHYSAATACADAALMARRIGKKRTKVLMPENMHPEYRKVVKTNFCEFNDTANISFKDGLIDRDDLKKNLNENTACVFVQSPNCFGIVEDYTDIAKMTHDAGALLISVCPEPISLGLLKTPGNFDSDIAVGEGLSLGLPVSFGGPTLGIFTVKEKHLRNMPGRVAGKTVDADNKTSYALTLCTREQHIRREKATSNICSNQALCATTAAVYLSLLGKSGIYDLANLNAALANYAKTLFFKIEGVDKCFDQPTFNEFTFKTKMKAKTLLDELSKHNIIGGIDLGRWYDGMDNSILFCVTEMNSVTEIDAYADALKNILS